MGKVPGSGRKKGSRNRRTFDAQELARRLDVDPLEVLLLAAKGDKKRLKLKKDDTISLEDRLYAARAAAPYLYPKKKAIEFTGGGEAIQVIIVPDKVDGDTWEEKAAAVRAEQQRVQRELLEQQQEKAAAQ